ncbi:hypothetical protein JH146_0078 [Methanocaldococcus bathoardescens]|uniref:HAD family hydrolase n=1 Tax=Methanocaldococcus bathoardescens TaxID=1301915 RepID=A0A076LHC0_9EURY|nr:HAD family hydrolase [Methanocaldococcus bathoardescens]AIJ04929.1 hypothetical protein JH146_0078 [Methanocaldococcus bathoardescens]
MKLTIFFDLDGTLIDTSDRHYKVYNDILKLNGFQISISKEKFWELKREGKKTIEMLPNNCPKEFAEKFKNEWIKRIEKREYLKLDTPIYGVSEVLSMLYNKNIELILVTLRHNESNLIWELKNLKLIRYFKEILVGSPLELKDKSILIKKYLTNHSSKTADLLIVGDSETDILAGKYLGISSVAVTYGIRSKNFLKKLNPEFYIDNIYELPKIIEKIR